MQKTSSDLIRTGRHICAIVILALAGATALAGPEKMLSHPGPTNSDGCHFSESRGYHCH
jgi:hypothetical protein